MILLRIRLVHIIDSPTKILLRHLMRFYLQRNKQKTKLLKNLNSYIKMNKITTLVSLSEFVPTLADLPHHEYRQYMNRYHAFLQQPLELWQFVPVGDDGNILEDPEVIKTNTKSWHPNHTISFNGFSTTLYDYEKQFEKAKQRCLFEGFSMCDRGNDQCVVHEGEHLLTWKGRNVEYLVNYNLPLSESALNQIY